MGWQHVHHRRPATLESLGFRGAPRVLHCHHNSHLQLFTTWNHIRNKTDCKVCISSWIAEEDLAFIYLPNLKRLRVTIELHSPHCRSYASFYGPELARQAVAKVVRGIKGTMMRLHSCKVSMGCSMDEEHMRHLYHK